MKVRFHAFSTKFLSSLWLLPWALKITVIILLFASVLGFRLNEWLEREKTARSIESILRNEYRTANSYALSKSIADLESLGIMRCTVLTEKSAVDRIYYDTSNGNHCWKIGPVTNWLTSSSRFQAINGQEYELTFQQPTTASSLMLELMTHSLILIVFSLYAQHSLRQIHNSELRMKLLSIERELALNNAKQIGHDVASPIGALKMAIQLLKDIDPALRDQFVKALARTEEIFGQLKTGLTENKNLTAITVEDCLAEIINEKRMLWGPACEINFDELSLHDLHVLANPQELKRILSNILNNAHESRTESNGLKINMKGKVTGPKVELLIEDNGKGMNPNTLSHIGESGFSFDKVRSPSAGLGMGVHHAIKTLESWGGTLRYSSQLGYGTLAIITLRRA